MLNIPPISSLNVTDLPFDGFCQQSEIRDFSTLLGQQNKQGQKLSGLRQELDN